MMKPDTVELGQEADVTAEILLNGFTIIARKKLQMSRAQGEEFYAELRGLRNRDTGEEIMPPLVRFLGCAMSLAAPLFFFFFFFFVWCFDPSCRSIGYKAFIRH